MSFRGHWTESLLGVSRLGVCLALQCAVSEWWKNKVAAEVEEDCSAQLWLWRPTL